MTFPKFAAPSYQEKPPRQPEQFNFELAVRKLMRKHTPRMTIKVLAERVERAPFTVRECLMRNAPTIATCERFAKALGVSLVEFIQEGYIR